MIQVNYPLPYTLETSLPASGYDGQLVLDTTASILYYWLNGQWNAITGGGADGTFDFMDGNDLQFMDGNSAAFMAG